MRQRVFTIAAAGCIVGAVFAGCMDSPGNTVEEAKAKMESAARALRAARATNAQERQKFKSESEHKVRENKNSINAFRERLEQNGSRLAARYETAIADLEQRNHDLEEQIDDFKDEGEATWEAFKGEFNKDMKKVEKALEDLTAESG